MAMPAQVLAELEGRKAARASTERKIVFMSCEMK